MRSTHVQSIIEQSEGCRCCARQLKAVSRQLGETSRCQEAAFASYARAYSADLGANGQERRQTPEMMTRLRQHAGALLLDERATVDRLHS
jgi:hypothetical protein